MATDGNTVKLPQLAMPVQRRIKDRKESRRFILDGGFIWSRNKGDRLLFVLLRQLSLSSMKFVTTRKDETNTYERLEIQTAPRSRRVTDTWVTSFASLCYVFHFSSPVLDIANASFLPLRQSHREHIQRIRRERFIENVSRSVWGSRQPLFWHEISLGETGKLFNSHRHIAQE